MAMTDEAHPSMHHFSSQSAYETFLTDLADSEAETIQEWGAYEVASSIVARVDDRSDEIEVTRGPPPSVDRIDAPLCPITVLEYSQATSGLPRDEVEHITHLAVELLEQDLQRHSEND